MSNTTHNPSPRHHAERAAQLAAFAELTAKGGVESPEETAEIHEALINAGCFALVSIALGMTEDEHASGEHVYSLGTARDAEAAIDNICRNVTAALHGTGPDLTKDDAGAQIVGMVREALLVEFGVVRHAGGED